jgi:hypothetical protein
MVGIGNGHPVSSVTWWQGVSAFPIELSHVFQGFCKNKGYDRQCPYNDELHGQPGPSLSPSPTARVHGFCMVSWPSSGWSHDRLQGSLMAFAGWSHDILQRFLAICRVSQPFARPHCHLHSLMTFCRVSWLSAGSYDFLQGPMAICRVSSLSSGSQGLRVVGWLVPRSSEVSQDYLLVPQLYWEFQSYLWISSQSSGLTSSAVFCGCLSYLIALQRVSRLRTGSHHHLSFFLSFPYLQTLATDSGTERIMIYSCH